jgi:membrane fusion protein, multidrug efflux system
MKLSSAGRAAAFGLAFVRIVCQTPAVLAGTPSVLVRTTPVVEKTVADTLDAFGTLEPDPDQVLSLSLPHAGLINRVWVRLGQRVENGDQLLEVVTAPDARMQFLQAQSAVDFARRELERQQRLLNEQLATKAQVDAAGKNLKDAETTLHALEQRGQGVTRETLRAPMKGIITRLDISQGQRVQADTTAMLIAAEQRLIARLGVEPEDLASAQAGTPVTITPVFVPDVKISSVIREVHAMIDPGTQLVEVLAEIPDHQAGKLILGSRVLGSIQLASRDALVVPRSAVLEDENGAYLYIVDNGKARRVAVNKGTEQGELVAVSGELKAGDTVVVSGNYELADGMAVRETP